MTYLHEQGYGVPAVEELSSDETGLVMQRIEGLSMVEAIERAPWTVRRHARTLAEVHRSLHEIEAPSFLTSSPVGRGDRIVHMDLHPLNVLVGPKGAVVIDWANARAGDPNVDVGIAWVLMSAGQIPGGRVKTALLGWGRSLLVNAFLSGFDRGEVTRLLGEIVEWKAKDTHMSAGEIVRMRQLVRKAQGHPDSGAS